MEEEIAEDGIRRRAFEIKYKGLGIYTTERDATPASIPAQAVLCSTTERFSHSGSRPA
jgi:hypothetical protein